jgi:quercetin dioxygenase-like cupin family protein
MISLVERGESSPTAVVLARLATGLGVTMAAIFDTPTGGDAAGPLARRADQREWRDPDSGYVRRNVSPAGMPQPMSIVDVTFPPGARITFDSAERGPHVQQQVWVLEGTMEITLGSERWRLEVGDCLAMLRDRPITFNNPASSDARYAIVIAAELR